MRQLLAYAVIIILVAAPAVISLRDSAPGRALTEATGAPDSTTIVVDVHRVRAMSVAENVPDLYLSVAVNGAAVPTAGKSVYHGRDIWFEDPAARSTISYDPDEAVTVELQLWEQDALADRQCDISPCDGDGETAKTLTLSYDVRSGDWTGDDYLGDGDGSGHASGYGDGDEGQMDCEIWFDIYQQDDDSSPDRLTYWEKQQRNLTLDRDYSQQDIDGDGVPTDWEDRWGYDPLTAETHASLDPDMDGLTNVQEWNTSQWLSNPRAKDIFIEVDGMQGQHAWSQPYTFPETSQHMLRDAFVRHNITVHIDDGAMAGGGDLIPYREYMDGGDLRHARQTYFLNFPYTGSEWKRGVFHYALICCQVDIGHRPAGGCAFAIDGHVIGGQYVKNWAPMFLLQGSEYYRAFASVFMHELGHTLGLHGFEGIDNENSRFPWNKEFYEWAPYRSCMNYRYVYKVVDYSIGDDDDHDQDDWSTIDLTRFARDDW